MLKAQLHGKLSKEQENLEDILTSNVFGSFIYVPVNEGLIPFISLAEKTDGFLLGDRVKGVNNARYEFWPPLQKPGCEFCEPDVLIELNHSDNSKSLILIEAKYRSGKSSWADEGIIADIPPRDQLAKEWHNLLKLAEELNASPYLIYVTADFAFPKYDIRASQEELMRKGFRQAELYWLSWRDLKKALKETSHLILLDLIELMDKRYELTTFENLTVKTSLRYNWKFYEKQLKVKWAFSTTTSPWHFSRAENSGFRWGPFKSKSMAWRFES